MREARQVLLPLLLLGAFAAPRRGGPIWLSSTTTGLPSHSRMFIPAGVAGVAGSSEELTR